MRLRPLRSTVALLCFAALPRLLVSILLPPIVPPLSDSDYYDATAQSLAVGQGYTARLTTDGFLVGGDPTAFFLPGYSHLLAALYAVFGPHTILAAALNVACGILVVGLTYGFTGKFFSRRVAFLSALLAAILPAFILWTPVILSETAFCAVLMASLVAAMKTVNPQGRFQALPLLITASLAGCAILLRAQGILIVPIVIALWWGVTRLRRTALLQASLVLVVIGTLLPLCWAIRNHVVMDRFTLTTSFGYNLRVGHAPFSTGRFVDPAELRNPDFTSLDELERRQDGLGARLAVDYATEHPLREVTLAVRKTYWLWVPPTDVTQWLTGFGLRHVSEEVQVIIRVTLLISQVAVLASAVVGLAASARSPFARWVTFVCFLWTAFHLVFFSEPRYLIPILPLLLPFTVVGVTKLQASLSTRLAAKEKGGGLSRLPVTQALPREPTRWP
jgi:4-amino-4-deoxy-L-arabinose transferase-like glycosyltransferase